MFNTIYLDTIFYSTDFQERFSTDFLGNQVNFFAVIYVCKPNS